MTDTAIAPRSDTLTNVTRVVKVLMALNGWDQAALAAQIGRNPPSVSKLLGGGLRWSVDDIARLAEAFDCPPGLFFEPVEQLVRNRCFRQPEQLVLDLETGPLVEQMTLRLAPGVGADDSTNDDGEPLAAIAA